MEKVDKQRRYHQIREILSEHRELTAKEIATEMMHKGYVPTNERNWAAPRCTELLQMGELALTGKKKDHATNRWVWMYALLPEYLKWKEVQP